MSSWDDTHSDDDNSVGAHEGNGDTPFTGSQSEEGLFDDTSSSDGFSGSPDDEGSLFEDSPTDNSFSDSGYSDEDYDQDYSGSFGEDEYPEDGYNASDGQFGHVDESESGIDDEFAPEDGSDEFGSEGGIDDEFGSEEGSEPGYGLAAYDPDGADDDYLGPKSESGEDHVADDGERGEFDRYDPSRTDTIGPIEEREEEDDSLGWKWILGLIIFGLLIAGATAYGIYYLTKDDQNVANSANDQSTSQPTWPTDLNLPQDEQTDGEGTESGEPSSVEDLQAAVSSLQAERDRLNSENEQLKTDGAGTFTSTVVSNRTQTRTQTQTRTNTSTRTLPPPAPVTRTVTRTLPPPAPRTVRVTDTVTAPPPRPVTRTVNNTVTTTTTIPGGRVTITRTIIDRPR